jgi:hypothetical protein
MKIEEIPSTSIEFVSVLFYQDRMKFPEEIWDKRFKVSGLSLFMPLH